MSNKINGVKSELAARKRRQARAAERKLAVRSPKDQLAWLDAKFGTGLGAAKERLKLNHKLVQNMPVPSVIKIANLTSQPLRRPKIVYDTKVIK